MTPDGLVLIFVALLGALVGSFANVAILRVPAGRSVVRPRSSCPACGRVLGPAELVPVLSWILQRGRCRGCGGRVSVRYALVEALLAGAFVAVALAWPPLEHPLAFVMIATWATLLLIAAGIDLDTYEIPDVLTLPGTALLAVASIGYGTAPGLPGPADALFGAALAAGVLTMVNRIGALVLRRFRDTRERLWPIGFDQANLAALAGALAGLAAGLLVAAASLLTNLATRRTVRLPEPLLWSGWLLALALSPWTVGVAASAGGGLAACGAAALVGAVVWWIADLRARARSAERPEPSDGDGASDAEEPVAMGFGDVKLAALLGVVLGWERTLLALFLAVLIGAVIGVAQRLAGGGRTVPFGPFLALGGGLALAFGDGLIAAYLAMLGF